MKVALLGDDEYNTFKENPVALPDEFDFLYYDDHLFVFKPLKFERTLDYFDSYIQDADDIISYLEDSNINIDRFDEFVESVKRSESSLRKMKQIKQMGRYDEVTQDIAEQLISEWDCSIYVDTDDDGEWQICIPNLRKKNEILKLFYDKYVVSGIDMVTESHSEAKYIVD